MAIRQVNGDPVTANSTKNSGGSVVNGGTSVILDNVGLGYYDVGVFGTRVIDGNDTDKALDAGTFSYDNQKPIAKRVTEELSDVENTFLQSGAAVPENVRSIHKLETLRTRRYTTAIREGQFNIYTGKFDPAVTVAVDALENDDAATPSRSVPGELVYKTSAPVPVMDEYKPKTNWSWSVLYDTI